MRFARWQGGAQALAGTGASVSRICPRQSQLSTCCQTRMKIRVLGGGTPHCLRYRRVMLLMCSNVAIDLLNAGGY